MASGESFFVTTAHFLSPLLFILSLSFLLTVAEANNKNTTVSLFFTLTSAPLTSQSTSFLSSLAASPLRRTSSDTPPLGYSSKTPFRYSMALIVTLLIGTPPQPQRMVIDTGSQLSWILCHRKKTRDPPPAAASFDPSLSTSFSMREEVVRRTGGGKLMKKDFVYAEAFDMCFDAAKAAAAARLIGDVALVFSGGVEITVPKERIMDDVGSGVHCIAVGRSEFLGVPGNIIGNFYQQNLWVEFDLVNRRVGFGPADCSRSV
ncbi:Eukaryotic aspartyl protease family protein [Striga hermonthica]|uniref:Eukaryotic aspartyl protease family protein n=1 Tax=Striga hermonthica TaxID=68872 RepID=A0A9N7NSB2_STRHE|nr:Eukaryotic aspartyl protease family protein [Striga hermonthica]